MPQKPIVGTHVDENGCMDLTVTRVFPENGVECVVRFNEEHSNPLEFLAMAMSNQILQNISEYDKMARDVLYTCDILAGNSEQLASIVITYLLIVVLVLDFQLFLQPIQIWL
jgi:hypothetical protein